jgi:hypothetical protein
MIFQKLETIRAAFDETLKPWFEARHALVNELCNISIKEMSGSIGSRRVRAMVVVLRRISIIRRLYIVMEIFAPVLFAFFAIVYVEFI